MVFGYWDYKKLLGRENKMQLSKETCLRLVTLMSSVAVVLTFMGNGCAGYKKDIGFETGAQSTGSSVEQSGVQTLAVVNFSNILKSFDAMVASTTPNNFQCSTRAAVTGANGAYTQNVGSLSLDGGVGTINAPMQMAVLKIAAEYCACAADQSATGSRSNLFAGFNLTQGPAQFTDQAVADLGSRLSQVLWAGVWDAGYATILADGVREIISRAPAGTAAATVSSQAAIGACTSMMSSFFAIEM